MSLLRQNLQKKGTLIYIDQNVKYKIREELNLCKSKEIESTFLEIIENNRKKCYCWMYLQTPCNHSRVH